MRRTPRCSCCRYKALQERSLISERISRRGAMPSKGCRPFWPAISEIRPVFTREPSVLGARPIREIAVFGDLKRAEHAEIQMPAAHQRKAVGMAHKAGARAQRHVLAAGVDQPAVDLLRRRRRPHAENAVLGMEDHLALGRHIIADERWDTDAEIDRPPLGDVLRETRGQCVAFERAPVLVCCHMLCSCPIWCCQVFSGGSPASTCTTRST